MHGKHTQLPRRQGCSQINQPKPPPPCPAPQRFAGTPLTSDDFKAFFLEHFQGCQAVQGIDWDTWYYAPGKQGPGTPRYYAPGQRGLGTPACPGMLHALQGGLACAPGSVCPASAGRSMCLCSSCPLTWESRPLMPSLPPAGMPPVANTYDESLGQAAYELAKK